MPRRPLSLCVGSGRRLRRKSVWPQSPGTGGGGSSPFRGATSISRRKPLAGPAPPGSRKHFAAGSVTTWSLSLIQALKPSRQRSNTRSWNGLGRFFGRLRERFMERRWVPFSLIGPTAHHTAVMAPEFGFSMPLIQPTATPLSRKSKVLRRLFWSRSPVKVGSDGCPTNLSTGSPRSATGRAFPLW
jgi:hypothetical protein